MKPVEEAKRVEPPPEHGAEPTIADREAASAAELTWRLVRRVHLGTRKPANWLQLVKFGIVGASGYFVNLVVFGLLVGVVGVHHIAAAVGAFAVAVMNNFMLNRHWTFEATAGHAGFQAARFFTVSLAALGINLVLLAVLVDIAGAPDLPSQAIAVAVAMPFNFVGNKLWTFGGG